MELFEDVKGYELEVSNVYELSLDRITWTFYWLWMCTSVFFYGIE
jgi:hypothetical protein